MKDRDEWKDQYKKLESKQWELENSEMVAEEAARDNQEAWSELFSALDEHKYGKCDCRDTFVPLLKKQRERAKKIWEMPKPVAKVSKLRDSLKETKDKLKKTEEQKDKLQQVNDTLNDRDDKRNKGESKEVQELKDKLLFAQGREEIYKEQIKELTDRLAQPQAIMKVEVPSQSQDSE